jgi:L-rhamnose mutarotase
VHRVGFVCKVKEERIAEYRQYHAHAWPEMLEALGEPDGTTTHYLLLTFYKERRVDVCIFRDTV